MNESRVNEGGERGRRTDNDGVVAASIPPCRGLLTAGSYGVKAADGREENEDQSKSGQKRRLERIEEAEQVRYNGVGPATWVSNLVKLGLIRQQS